MTRNITIKNDVSKAYDTMALSYSKQRVSIGLEDKIKEYFYIDIDNIMPYHKQARQVFDEQEIVNLSETIKAYGIRQPLTIIKSKDYGIYHVISGERRLRAAKLAGLKKVPCILIDDMENYEEVAIIENIQRENLHPIELGIAYHSLLSKYNYGELTALAKKLGVSKSQITEYIKFSELPEEIKQYLLKNNIKSRIILRKLSNCTELDQMKLMLGVFKDSILKSKSLTIARIVLNQDDIDIKFLHRLNDTQKRILKDKLEIILRSL